MYKAAAGRVSWAVIYNFTDAATVPYVSTFSIVAFLVLLFAKLASCRYLSSLMDCFSVRLSQQPGGNDFTFSLCLLATLYSSKS